MQQTTIHERYSLVRPIGDGGMARVYLAHDEVLGRDVALKVLRDRHAGDEEFIERFRREARSAAALSHPNVIEIHDWGQAAEGGMTYIVMEYLAGGTLENLLALKARMKPRTAIEVALQVADALSAAHERGVVHRDIKPQNILIAESGAIKVADFGIAKMMELDTLTQTRLVLGTARYMSPEQALSGPVGPASDLYSLGVVLYEMLSGEALFHAETAIGMAVKHVNEPPRPLRGLNPEIPEGLAVLTEKLLSKDPEERHTDAAELMADLERLRDALPPVAARRGGPVISSDSGEEPEQPPAQDTSSSEVTLSRTDFERAPDLDPVRPPESAGSSAASEEPDPLPAPDRPADEEREGGGPAATPVPEGSDREPERAPEDDSPAIARPVLEEDPDRTSEQSPVPEAGGPALGWGAASRGTQKRSRLISWSLAALLVATGAAFALFSDWDPFGSPRIQDRSAAQEEPDAGRGGAPSVEGLSQEDAEQQLLSGGFAVDTQFGESSPEDTGRVIDQSAPDGGNAGAVSIVVGEGLPPGEDVEVPYLIGISTADAEADLEDAGLELGEQGEAPDDLAPPGYVVDQSPSSGETARQGTPIDVTVSSGPAR